MTMDAEALLGENANVRMKWYQRYCLIGGIAASFAMGFSAGRFSVSPPELDSPINTMGCQCPDASKKLWAQPVNPTYNTEMMAKSAVRKFDQYLMFGAAFDTPQRKLQNVRQWLADDFVYETVGFPGAKSAAEWCLSGEEQHFRTTFNMSEFTQMLFFGTDTMATTTSYGTVFWAKPLFGIPAANVWTRFRVIDFYKARKTGPNQAKLYWNFMMIDYVDLLRRNGINLLPPAALPDGFVAPPYSEDGVPAPLSVLVTPEDAIIAHKICKHVIEQDWTGTRMSKFWAKNATYYGPGGIGTATGTMELEKHVLRPFRAAFADRTLDVQIFDCEGGYCGATGHIKGKHVKAWLGLDASNTDVALRFAFHWRVHHGEVVGAWSVFDMPGLFTQLGMDFFGRAREIAASQGAIVGTASA